VIRFRILDRFFAKPAGYFFLTPEEHTLVAEHSSAPLAPSIVIGIGLEPARQPRTIASVSQPYALYLGRIDPNKGCETLLRYFLKRQTAAAARTQLIMAGPANLPLRDHPGNGAPGFLHQEGR